MNINLLIFWLIILSFVVPRCVLIIAFYKENRCNLTTKRELYSAVVTVLLFSEIFILYLFFGFLGCIFEIISNKIEKLLLFFEKYINRFIGKFIK